MNSLVIVNNGLALASVKDKIKDRCLDFFLVTTFAVNLCWVAPRANAQSPSTIAGTTFGVAIADGTYPFNNTGYYFVIANNSGTNLQLANVYGFADSGSTYNYTSNGANGQIHANSVAFAEIVDDLQFADNYFGNFTLTSVAFGGQQHGDFIWFNGSAPTSISGKVLACNINDGVAPFAATGSALLNISTTGNTYTIIKEGSTNVDSYGTYSYSRVNSSTGKLAMNDSKAGVINAVLAFADSWIGSFGLRNNSADSFQVGDFQIMDTSIPTLEISSPKSGRTLSNEVATISGRATDNASVLSVLYSINDSEWLTSDSTNNYQNWSANIVLTPGPNKLSAYAVDTSGNISTTNTATYFYVVSAPMSVSINGRGNIAPAYNNALLQIGANYTMTAIPAPGFNFAGWSDGTNIISTRPALSFSMAAGLSLYANFNDVARPTVSITSPIAGQRLSNDVFIVTGRSKDNDRVAQVYYSLNDSDWASVSAVNDWTTWTMSTAVRPGINRFKTFAVDATGNVSATNSVDFTYVLSAPIAIHANGGGRFTPFINGARLAIGQRYALTAIASNGCVFNFWKNSNGDILTNKPTVSFVMDSNLDLTADFSDILKPSINISKKTGDIIFSTDSATISGRASDNLRVADVFFKLNDGSWTEATSLNAWSDWTALLSLIPGTNYFSTYCIDASGNASAISSARIIYSTAPATLNNLVAEGISDSQQSFSLSFGSRSFGQFSPDVNSLNGVGTYTYLKLSACTGRLRLSYTAPPIAASSGYRDFILNFTGSNAAHYIGQTTIDSGNLKLTLTPSMTITSLVKRTLIYVNEKGVGQASYFNAGKFLATDLLAGNSNVGTTLVFSKFSPIITILKQTNEAGQFYTVVKNIGTNYGSTYVERYRPDGSFMGTEMGVFGLVSQQAEALVPPELVNQHISVYSGNKYFELAFTGNTFSQQSYQDSLESGVGNYSYSVTDTNTSSLALYYTAPANLNGSGSSTVFSFYAPNLAYLINSDNTISAAVFSVLTNSFTAAPFDRTIATTNLADGSVIQYEFFSDGNFSVTGQFSSTGSYTYNSFSPETGMFQLTFANGDYAGNSGWLQVNYDSTNNGNFKATIFDGGNNLLNVGRGNFGQQ